MPQYAACAGILAVAFLALAAPAEAASHQLEDLTWTEVRDAVRAGTTTVIIPVGGVEQNGPHMALGKHNFRAAALSARIAAKLGNAIVAPVVNYVPEGNVAPPSGHMKFPGTISVPEDAFMAILAGAARSLKQGGFLDIVLVGDSGNYQGQLGSVAQRLNREWAGGKARVHYIGAYYQAASTEYNQALRSRGFTDKQIGTHAALADTSLMLAIDPSRVHSAKLASSGDWSTTGVAGDPAPSTAALGQLGVDLIVDRTVLAIRQAVAARTPKN